MILFQIASSLIERLHKKQRDYRWFLLVRKVVEICNCRVSCGNFLQPFPLFRRSTITSKLSYVTDRATPTKNNTLSPPAIFPTRFIIPVLIVASDYRMTPGLFPPPLYAQCTSSMVAANHLRYLNAWCLERRVWHDGSDGWMDRTQSLSCGKRHTTKSCISKLLRGWLRHVTCTSAQDVTKLGVRSNAHPTWAFQRLPITPFYMLYVIFICYSYINKICAIILICDYIFFIIDLYI